MDARGNELWEPIAGVVLRPAVTHLDDRGEVCEILDSRWRVDEHPMVYTYWVMLRPGKIKGWVLHQRQSDRIFVALGAVRWVLYDPRPESPTRGRLNEIFLGERRRGLLVIPSGVWHAVQNVGNADAIFVNHPTRAYDHADPDKYRLPLDTSEIPYRFTASLGR